MTEFTVYARGDSSTANNSSINAESAQTVPTTELTFISTSGGDIILDPNNGNSDPDTLLSVNGGTPTTFTVEFSGTLPMSQKLANVNGYDLRGEEIVVITDDATGQRYFFLTNSEIFIDAATWEATMDAFPNGAHNIAATNPDDPVVICFTAGTPIDTPLGPRAVEDLRPGDVVLTRDHGPQTIRWAGSRTLLANGDQAPIVFAPGALGNSLPLLVSPQHRMLIDDYRAQLLFGEDEVLVAAKHLVNGQSIRQAPGGPVTYHHILLDRHEIVTAGGVATETYQPGSYSLNGLDPVARERLFAIHPELRADPLALGPSARPALGAAQGRLLAA